MQKCKLNGYNSSIWIYRKIRRKKLLGKSKNKAEWIVTPTQFTELTATTIQENGDTPPFFALTRAMYPNKMEVCRSWRGMQVAMKPQ